MHAEKLKMKINDKFVMILFCFAAISIARAEPKYIVAKLINETESNTTEIKATDDSRYSCNPFQNIEKTNEIGHPAEIKADTVYKFYCEKDIISIYKPKHSTLCREYFIFSGDYIAIKMHQ